MLKCRFLVLKCRFWVRKCFLGAHVSCHQNDTIKIILLSDAIAAEERETDLRQTINQLKTMASSSSENLTYNLAQFQVLSFYLTNIEKSMFGHY